MANKSSASAEKAIREAAAGLLAAINDGRKVGLAVTWPGDVSGLASIAISETAKVEAEAGTDGK